MTDLDKSKVLVNKCHWAYLVSIAFMLSACVVSPKTDTPSDKLKAKIVSRYYQALYGHAELCARFSPKESPEVDATIARFKRTYPELMRLIEHSPYLDIAKKRNREMVDDQAELAAEDTRYAGCRDTIAMLNLFIEQPDAVLETITELKK